MLTSFLSGTGPDKAMLNTGNNATFSSITRGSFASGGNSDLAKSTFSLISSKASSASKPALNSKVTEACPSPAVARISFNPSRDCNSFSIGRTSRRSASSGAMPSCVIET